MSALLKNVAEFAERPARLEGIKGAFSVRVFGDDLAPLYCDGDLVYCHPGEVPRPGTGAVVRLKAGGAYVGLLASLTDAAVKITNAQGKSPMTIQLDQVEVVGREVGVLRR